MRVNVRSGMRLGTMVPLGALTACGSDDPTDLGTFEARTYLLEDLAQYRPSPDCGTRL